MPDKIYTYLALGDSYTVGESLPLRDNFPSQVTRLLNESGYAFEEPTIVAKTGWTTDELAVGIKNGISQAASYDIVSLLIGVNNQYRGENTESYAWQFEDLLLQAIRFAGSNPSHVFVLSIPDWSVTPFAEGRQRAAIAREIDLFNRINRDIAARHTVHYVEITEGMRQDTTLVAADGLHPSAKEYKRWAEKLAAAIIQQLT